MVSKGVLANTPYEPLVDPNKMIERKMMFAFGTKPKIDHKLTKYVKAAG